MKLCISDLHEKFDLLTVNEGVNEGLHLSTSVLGGLVASVVDGCKGKVASLFNIPDDLLSGSRVLEEVGSPLVCNGPAESIDPLLSTLGRHD